MKPIAIVIHHTVTDQNITPEALRAIFKSRFGVDYIGYNFYIRGNGEVHSDLGPEKVGIHNNVGKFNNTNSVGISIAGNFEEQEPTQEQLNSLSNLILELQKNYQIPDENIVGHRDMKSTACPGKNLYKYKPWKKEVSVGYDDKHMRSLLESCFRMGREKLLGKVVEEDLSKDVDFRLNQIKNGSTTAFAEQMSDYLVASSFQNATSVALQIENAVGEAVEKERKSYETLIKEFEKKITSLEKDITEQAGLCEGKIDKAVKEAVKEANQKCKNSQVITYESAILNYLKRVWRDIWK